jgi:hypothetical protein
MRCQGRSAILDRGPATKGYQRARSSLSRAGAPTPIDERSPTLLNNHLTVKSSFACEPINFAGRSIEMGSTNKQQAMKCRVTCWIAGKIFYVDCQARNYEEAKTIALAQHPNARLLGVMAIFPDS